METTQITQTIFREYDIRGIYETELDEKTVKLIGYFLGVYICRQTKGGAVAVGYDAREHGVVLGGYLTSGLNMAGCHVLDMGMVATGVNYFAGYYEFDGIKTDATVMITGSHNPPQYNGFKITVDNKPFFGDDIYTLGETIVKNQQTAIADNTKATTIDVKTKYIEYMTKEFRDLRDMPQKFVFDCGHGVANTVLEQILQKLNINYKILYGDPDGTFPAHHPDPSEEKNLSDIKQELKADSVYGFAYDGDADRVAFLTKKQNIKPDMLAIILAKSLKNPTVIGEVKCSSVMYDTIEKNGGKTIMAKTGHSNLKVAIKKHKADFAVEVSGHLFFADRFFGFDDAVYATFRIMELINQGIDIDGQIASFDEIYNTDEIKIHTTEDTKFKIMDNIGDILDTDKNLKPQIKSIIDIDGYRINFTDGWALVRASNTTPVIVTRYESTKKENLTIYQEFVENLIKRATF